jgi:preprotein translocase subunit YajC
MLAENFLLFAQASPPPPGGEAGLAIANFMPFIAMGVVFYFLLIRPQQKKAKELQALVSSLRTGDKVVTSSGIHGIISNVKEETVIVKVADNVKIEFNKSSIATVAKRPDASAATA